MGSLDNNTTLYDDEYLSFSDKVDTQSAVVKWPIEVCQRLNIINNNTDVTNLTETVFTYNGTSIRCLKHSPVLETGTLVRASVLSVMAVFSFIGNVATIISIRREKRSRGRARPSWTAIYSLIFQLSIADLLVTIFCIGGEAAWMFIVEWHAGNVGCKLLKYMQMFSLYLSTYIMVLIGIDRWLALKSPLKSMGTATRSRRLVIAAWVVSAVFSIPQSVVFQVVKGPFVEEFYQCVTYGTYSQRWQEQLYTTLTLVCMFVLPLLTLVSSYVSTVRIIAQSEKVFKPEVMRQENYLTPDMNRRRLIDRAKMKSLRMSVVIVAAFLIWWTPYYVMMLIFTFLDPDKNQSEDLRSGIFFFGMSNSLMNPLIYGAFHLWPRKKPLHRHSDRESGGHHASLLRRGDNTSSVRLTTVRSIRSSAKYSNGHNVSLL